MTKPMAKAPAGESPVGGQSALCCYLPHHLHESLHRLAAGDQMTPVEHNSGHRCYAPLPPELLFSAYLVGVTTGVEHPGGFLRVQPDTGSQLTEQAPVRRVQIPSKVGLKQRLFERQLVIRTLL